MKMVRGARIWATDLLKHIRSTVETEAARGTKNAQVFLLGNPTRAEILQAWSDACCDADMSYGHKSKAYAEAFKEVLRPYWMDVK